MSGRAIIYSLSLTRKANQKSVFPFTRYNNSVLQFRKFSDDKSNSNDPTIDSSIPTVPPLVDDGSTSTTETNTIDPLITRGEQTKGTMQSVLKSTILKSDLLLKIKEGTLQHKRHMDVAQMKQQQIEQATLQLAAQQKQKDAALESGVISQSTSGTNNNTERRIYNSRLARANPNANRGEFQQQSSSRQQRPRSKLSSSSMPGFEDMSSGMFAGAGDLGGGGGGGGGRRSRKFGDELNDDDNDDNDDVDDEYDDDDEDGRKKKYDADDEEIPPEVESMLFEYMKGEKNKHAFGYQVSPNDMDDIDQFLAHVYMETRKTSDNTFQAILETPQFRRVQLPTPRPLSECLLTTKPDIPKEVSDEYCRQLGERSWEVLSKNIYVNEGQKRFISQMIAKKAQEHFDFHKYRIEREKVDAVAKAAQRSEFMNANEIPVHKKTLSFEDDDDDDDDYSPNRKNFSTRKRENLEKIPTKEFMYEFSQDIIFKRGFRKGMTYMEEQQRLEMGKEYIRPSGFDQAETDWSIDAVEDEDALFASDSDEEEGEEDGDIEEDEDIAVNIDDDIVDIIDEDESLVDDDVTASDSKNNKRGGKKK